MVKQVKTRLTNDDVRIIATLSARYLKLLLGNFREYLEPAWYAWENSDSYPLEQRLLYRDRYDFVEAELEPIKCLLDKFCSCRVGAPTKGWIRLRTRKGWTDETDNIQGLIVDLMTVSAHG